MRTYKYKSPVLEFFCPLCRTPRALSARFRLRAIHYVQMLLVSTLLMSLFYSLMQERVFFLLFPVWLLFEWCPRAYLRKEIPCPHCGLDAIWYKRDLKVAKKKIEEFWKAPSSDINKIES